VAGEQRTRGPRASMRSALDVMLADAALESTGAGGFIKPGVAYSDCVEVTGSHVGLIFNPQGRSRDRARAGEAGAQRRLRRPRQLTVRVMRGRG